MSVVVVGCGRSGTNMVLEILRGNSFFKATEPPEDKKVFHSSKSYSQRYLTKCDTAYFNFEKLEMVMEMNHMMKLVWTVRDPRDMILSKMRRGVPRSNGGDCKTLADDATPDGAIKDIERMMVLLISAIKRYSPNRLLVVKMEDVIQNIEISVAGLCRFLKIDIEMNMLTFYDRMRNKDKAKRYSGIDKSQVAMWKRWDTVYDGWFKESKHDIPGLFNRISGVTEWLGYV